jgi:pimeloyl-ACP methyl ester carboxylesterase
MGASRIFVVDPAGLHTRHLGQQRAFGIATSASGPRSVPDAERVPPILLGEPMDLPLRGELRYGLELARLMSDPAVLHPVRRADAPPVLLVPGFMAGDASLAVLRSWLRRRGSRTSSAGMRLNVDCAERAVERLEPRLRKLTESAGRRAVVIGQSRGGELARVLAVRNRDAVSTLVMLGSPVLEPLSVDRAVLGALRSVARLGDLGVPGMLSTRCADGACCAAFREDLQAPLPPGVRAVAIYSRSDGIVSWRACLDPGARQIEVASSHAGMSVNRAVYRALAEILDEVS